MNAIVPRNMGQVSTKFVTNEMDNELAAGIHSGYGVISYKGKVFAIKKGGVSTPLLREDDGTPRGSIEVVILKAPAHLSKIYYPAGYVEGSSEAPDCFSTNGVTPDASSKAKQANACANCPKNQWGSKISEAGKQMKACSDSKRIAVAPLGDLENEAFGGPMLLRVPAGSLQEIAAYGQKMQALGYPYYAIGTRISFDPLAAYPKLVFGAIRALSDEEAEQVVALRNSPQVARILAEGSETVSAQPLAQTVAAVFEQPPAPAPAAPKPDAKPRPELKAAPKAAPKGAPEQVAAPAPAPVQEVTEDPSAPTGTSFDASLDAELDALLPK